MENTIAIDTNTKEEAQHIVKTYLRSEVLRIKSENVLLMMSMTPDQRIRYLERKGTPYA